MYNYSNSSHYTRINYLVSHVLPEKEIQRIKKNNTWQNVRNFSAYELSSFFDRIRKNMNTRALNYATPMLFLISFNYSRRRPGEISRGDENERTRGTEKQHCLGEGIHNGRRTSSWLEHRWSSCTSSVWQGIHPSYLKRPLSVISIGEREGSFEISLPPVCFEGLPFEWPASARGNKGTQRQRQRQTKRERERERERESQAPCPRVCFLF